MTIEQVQQHTGAVGASVTGGSAFIGFVTDAIPVLQALSLLVSIVAGALTALWYVRKFLKR